MAHTLHHTLWLLSAVLTHAAVGYALASALTDAPAWVGALAGVAPDADLPLGPPVGPFPWVHRGLVHTPVFLACVVAVVLLLSRDRDATVAVGIALLSHLVIDSLTDTGIAWLYPLSAEFFAFDLDAHATVPTLALWLTAGLLVAYARDSDGSPLGRLSSRASDGGGRSRRE